MNSNNVYKGLLYGGIASCLAETCTMPVDVVKTRLQMDGAGRARSGRRLLYQGPLDCARQLVRAQGPMALFKGLPPALVRQATYGTLRYGLYSPIRNALMGGEPLPDETPSSTTKSPLWKKIVAGGCAGALASAVANPTDLIKVRLQTDGQFISSSSSSSTTAQNGEKILQQPRRQYRGMMHALQCIVRQEGVRGLWKGVGPTMGRATALAAAELSTYDQIKGLLLLQQQSSSSSSFFQEGLACTVTTAAISGWLGTVASSPFDVVKSRVMGQPVQANGTGTLYRGMVHCFVVTVQQEGIMSLYKGFWPNFGRIVPRVVIVFVVMEHLKTWFG